ncbi:MAG: hypothetical protein EBU90_20150, partial [Proteobacteria bacterium]|nr:hypothetical protein [Pseudomonadota bacterium]
YDAKLKNAIRRDTNAAAAEVCSRYNDGYTAFFSKQDLYQIYWHLDNILRECPKFSGEEEWLREQEKKRIIKYLKT